MEQFNSLMLFFEDVDLYFYLDNIRLNDFMVIIFVMLIKMKYQFREKL